MLIPGHFVFFLKTRLHAIILFIEFSPRVMLVGSSSKSWVV